MAVEKKLPQLIMILRPKNTNLIYKLIKKLKTEFLTRAGKEYEPHFLTLYLTELAAEFNSYYAKNKIVDRADEFSPYKVALTNAFCQIMKNGMWMLGIKTLEKM